MSVLVISTRSLKQTNASTTQIAQRIYSQRMKTCIIFSISWLTLQRICLK